MVSTLYYGLHIDDLLVAIGADSYNRSLHKAIKKFNPDIVGDKASLAILKKDIKHSYYVCKANPEEYFLLGLADCDDEKRKSFVTDKFMYMTMGKYVSRKKHDTEIEDKYNFYQLARKYFKREVMKVCDSSSFDEFVQKALRVQDLILKPLDSAMGAGIFATSIKSKEDAKSVFDSLITKGGS